MSGEGTIVGKLLDGPQERDAIHIAVASVVAGEFLRAGQHIDFDEGGSEIVTLRDIGCGIGIVDPFLREDVGEGQRFWMFLYPNTITSLKHNWTHPAFAATSSSPDEERRALSEKWLRNFAEGHDETYQTMIEAATAWVKTHDYFYGRYPGTNYNGKFEGESVPDEFWDHYQRVTGKLVDGIDRTNFFACSC